MGCEYPGTLVTEGTVHAGYHPRWIPLSLRKNENGTAVGGFLISTWWKHF